jgi:hypothetical protein
MKNDLLDYWGGSSERNTVLEDLRRCDASFPVTILLEESLEGNERSAIISHFRYGAPLGAADLFGLFLKYEIPQKCVSLLEAEIRASERTIENFRLDGHLVPLYQLLLRWNRHMLNGCRARVLKNGCAD